MPPGNFRAVPVSIDTERERAALASGNASRHFVVAVLAHRASDSWDLVLYTHWRSPCKVARPVVTEKLVVTSASLVVTGALLVVTHHRTSGLT